MDLIIAHLKESIEDEFLSKTERRTLKSLIGDSPLDRHQLNVLRSKMYELANEKINDTNYRFIMEWIRNVNNTLLNQPQGASADAYFSPGEACRSAIINQINTAIKQLRICVFTISDDLISDSIITAHQKGVSVQIITDNDKLHDEGSDIGQLVDRGITVKIDNTPNHMHHKFMVVDERTLITGSYNWTRSAARYNHENILLTRELGVVRSFLKEFNQLWKVMHQY
jgi:mitochondrial cardiolipin hydrolase